MINSLEKRRVCVVPPRPAAPPSPRLQCSTSASSSPFKSEHHYKYKQHATVNTALLFRVHPSVKIKPHAINRLSKYIYDRYKSLIFNINYIYNIYKKSFSAKSVLLYFFARIYKIYFSPKICSYFMETMNCKVILFIYFLEMT